MMEFIEAHGFDKVCKVDSYCDINEKYTIKELFKEFNRRVEILIYKHSLKCNFKSDSFVVR